MLKVACRQPMCRIARFDTSRRRCCTGSGRAEGYWWRRKLVESG
jgi:hypothetical protein